MELYVSYPGQPSSLIDTKIESEIGVKAHSTGYNLVKAVRDLQFDVPRKRAQRLIAKLNGHTVLNRPLTISDKMPDLF